MKLLHESEQVYVKASPCECSIIEHKCRFKKRVTVRMSLTDELVCADSSAVVLVTQGPFSADDPKEYSVDVRISDGGQPVKTSVTKLAIKVCMFDLRAALAVNKGFD